MRATEQNKRERSNVFVLAPGISGKGGYKVSRNERLRLALVDLRDRIHREFVRVAKGWQVTTEDLRCSFGYDGSRSVRHENVTKTAPGKVG